MSLAAAQATAPACLPMQYPTALIDARWLGDAKRLVLRPVLPQDEPLLLAMVLAQSAEARRKRFHSAIKPSHRWCRQMSHVDYRSQLALVVSTMVGGDEQLVADARYGVVGEGQGAELALMVDERWQRRGVGTWVLQALQKAAAGAGLDWLEAEVLLDNHAMLQLAQRTGFDRVECSQDGLSVRLRRRLAAPDVSTHRLSGLLRRLA